MRNLATVKPLNKVIRTPNEASVGFVKHSPQKVTSWNTEMQGYKYQAGFQEPPTQ